MTDIADCPPATDEIESLLAQLEDDRFADALWVDAEFYAIIAANWDTEPPEPPGTPTGRPARWNDAGTVPGPGSRQRLADQVMTGDLHRRQRSPPR